jgi:heme-degrading monooxygenase HmoA
MEVCTLGTKWPYSRLAAPQSFKFYLEEPARPAKLGIAGLPKYRRFCSENRPVRCSLEYGFLAVWRFRVRPEKNETFERIYGPDGEWATLFRTAEGYQGTKLMRSAVDPQLYLTFDFWKSEADYKRFRTAHLQQYQEIDARCESLTEDEVEIGSFIPCQIST